jgi:hypothetical protein
MSLNFWVWVSCLLASAFVRVGYWLVMGCCITGAASRAHFLKQASCACAPRVACVALSGAFWSATKLLIKSAWLKAVTASVGMEAPSCPRLSSLCREIVACTKKSSFFKGIQGLRLRIDRLRTLGVSELFLNWWEHGRPLGASPAPARFRRNHPSFIRESEWAERELLRLESFGKVEFFSDPLRPPGLNINPLALLLKERSDVPADRPATERMKARLIVDLSRGDVNPRLPDIGVAYGTVDLAVSRMSPGCFLYVLDLQDCFFNWRVHPESAMELGFFCEARQRFGRFLYFPFGLGTSPGINDASIKELLRVVTLHTGVVLTDFVDDFLGAHSSLEDAWLALERVDRLLGDMGVPVSLKQGGIRPPATRQRWCGWIFDTVAGIVTVTQSKVNKALAGIDDVISADATGSLHARKLSSVAGLLSHIGEVFIQGRRRLHSVWAALNAANVYQLWALGSSADPLVVFSRKQPFHIGSLEWPVCTQGAQRAERRG